MIPIMLLLATVLFSGAVAASAPARAAGETPAPAPAPTLYRLELAGGGVLWSKDAPMQSGSVVTFHRYPDGVLLSIRRTDLTKVVITKPEPTAAPGKPGAVVDIGVTGGGAGSGG